MLHTAHGSIHEKKTALREAIYGTCGGGAPFLFSYIMPSNTTVLATGYIFIVKQILEKQKEIRLTTIQARSRGHRTLGLAMRLGQGLSFRLKEVEVACSARSARN